MSIEVKNLSYTYSAGTPYQQTAIRDISFSVEPGQFVGIVGATGSGKSTLIQHLNALIRPAPGCVTVFGADAGAKGADLRRLRGMVGMLFQYPEYQLFEETVLKDVCFAPLNFGMTRAEAEAAAAEAISLVGLDFEAVKDKSPFELSGGEKRRAAIAGIIASRPKILIMDEPTAGLDPLGKKEILRLCRKLKAEAVETVVVISHNMDEIAEYCDRILALKDGVLAADTTPQGLFSDKAALEALGLDVPHSVKIKLLLEEKGFYLDDPCLTVDALTRAVGKKLGAARGKGDRP